MEWSGEKGTTIHGDGTSSRKVFFFHIPKTAGTPFNYFLQTNLSPGWEHVEGCLVPGEGLRLSNIDELKPLNYITGHVPFPVFTANGFERDKYSLVTVLREPISHLASHVNWGIRIREIGGFEGHSAEVREMSDAIAQSNLKNPQEFISLLEKYRGMFQNVQARMFTNADGVASAFNAISNLKQLDLVGITERFDDFLAACSRLWGLSSPPAIPKDKANANPTYRVTKDWILNNRVALDFIIEYIALDLFVYRYALHSGEIKIAACGLEDVRAKCQS